MVEPQPSKLMMPVRSWSAALSVFAGEPRCVLSVAVTPLRFIPRISRALCSCRLRKRRQRLCDGHIAILRSVLIAQRGGWARVAGACHELPGRGPLRGGPCESGSTQVVEMNLRAAYGGSSSAPGGIERMAAEPSTLWSCQERCGRLSGDEGRQVSFQSWKQVGWNADHPPPGFCLGRSEIEPTADVVRRPLDVDPMVQQVNVPTLETEHLPNSQMAPRSQLDGDLPRRRHRARQRVDF